MKTALCTYCAGPKVRDDGLLPAIRRYDSDRIRSLEKKAKEDSRLFLILSGRFGLISGDTPIPWYDHLLLAEEVTELGVRVQKQMTALKLGAVIHHTADPGAYPEVRPYLSTIETAARNLGLDLTIVILPGNPV